jgi:hypothetical protein
MLLEFERLRKSKIKNTLVLLKNMAFYTLWTSKVEFTHEIVDPRDGMPLNKKLCLLKKEWHIEMLNHLGMIQQGFQFGKFDENHVENVDETHQQWENNRLL